MSCRQEVITPELAMQVIGVRDIFFIKIFFLTAAEVAVCEREYGCIACQLVLSFTSSVKRVSSFTFLNL